MSEAKLIIGEARKAVDDDETKKVVKKGEPPAATFKPADAPKADMKNVPSAAAEKEAPKSSDPFANISSPQSFNAANRNNNNNNNSNNANNNNSKPAQNNNAQAAADQAKQQNAKKNFNFDMAELLKAAEEEAAKDTEA
jgi:hypothetical protein